MICTHWQYLITLDDDLHKISRFIETNEKNFTTFSIEFVRILLAAGSEIDVVAKILCNSINSTKPCGNINDYRKTIVCKYPKFPTMVIDIPQYEIQLTPWKNWTSGMNPDWWEAYNNVKHRRDRYFKEANLNNAINAVSGLFVIVWYLHHEQSNRKKLNKPILLSADRYVAGVRWANNLSPKIPEELTH